MRITFTTGLWFLAAWVTFAMAAFAFGLPSQASPLVAGAVAVAVASLLSRRRLSGAAHRAPRVDVLLSDA